MNFASCAAAQGLPVADPGDRQLLAQPRPALLLEAADRRNQCLLHLPIRAVERHRSHSGSWRG